VVSEPVRVSIACGGVVNVEYCGNWQPHSRKNTDMQLAIHSVSPVSAFSQRSDGGETVRIFPPQFHEISGSFHHNSC